MLHDQRDHGPLAPPPRIQQAQRPPAVGLGRRDELFPARHIGALRTGAIGHQGLQQTHRIGSLAVPARFDVRVTGRVDGRGDGHAVGEVEIVTDGEPSGPDDGLGVGAGEHAEPRRQLGQSPGVPHPEQQLLGAVRAGGQDQVIGGEGLLPAAQFAAGAHRVHLPHAVGALLERPHRVQRMYARAGRLGQAQIVFQQRVLGAVPAARHALAAFDASGARGAGTAEVRVGHGLARCLLTVLTEEDAHRGRDEGVPHAHVLGDLLHDPVGIGERGVGDDPEHPLGLVVMRHELFAPVGDIPPLRVGEEGLRRHVEGVGVVQRATADTGSGQDHAVTQQVDALDAVHPELRGPQELAQVPGSLREVRVGKPPAGFQNPHAVSLFGEPQGADATAESRADDQDVVVRLHRTSMTLPAGNFLDRRA